METVYLSDEAIEENLRGAIMSLLLAHPTRSMVIGRIEEAITATGRWSVIDTVGGGALHYEPSVRVRMAKKS